MYGISRPFIDPGIALLVQRQHCDAHVLPVFKAFIIVPCRFASFCVYIYFCRIAFVLKPPYIIFHSHNSASIFYMSVFTTYTHILNSLLFTLSYYNITLLISIESNQQRLHYNIWANWFHTHTHTYDSRKRLFA